MDTTDSGAGVVRGPDAFLEFLQQTSSTTATGTWALHDVIVWPDGSRLDGDGHYHETYELVGGEWRIKSSTLTRLRTDFTGADS
jgi:hypothetical protein